MFSQLRSNTPASAHALHMPGHIFARLGLWQEDIRANLASKAATDGMQGMGTGAEGRLHAMEFLEYAYLQVGEDRAARAIRTEAQTISESDVDPRYPAYYGIVQSRYAMLLAVETGDWQAAARLQPAADANVFGRGLIELAHAQAAGHLHDAALAATAVRNMDGSLSGVPAAQVGEGMRTLRDEVRAWADFTHGDLDAATALLQPIADRQAQTGKGEVELPAREMLAEMLRLGGQPSAALAQYRASLASDPNRLNGLLGAAEAAAATGHRQLAAGYYRTAIANCPRADGPALVRLARARAFIAVSR